MDQFAGDSYEGYRFKVRLDGGYAAGFSRVGGLTQPDQVDLTPVTLEGGITHDIAFGQWADQVWNSPNTPQPEGSRREIIIEMYDDTGQRVAAYRVYRCWVSEYWSAPINDAPNGVAIRSMTVQNDGWDSV